ncbi:hypothetical protein FRC17_006448, partial [Serendipita sp. 399]
MGKKDKSKPKSKAAGGSGENPEVTFGDVFAAGYDGVTAAEGANGTRISLAGDRIEGFGPEGWGESQGDEQKYWHPDPNAESWDHPTPDISAWLGGTNDAIPGLMGSGQKKHSSAAVRMSLASQALHQDVPPDVAALLASMQAEPTGSPKRAPTELSVHRSSAAYSSNPLRSAMPTRANSISGGHAGSTHGAYPSIPPSTSLQQTRFFQRPAQPLSTIHSERSVHTLAHVLAAGEANAPETVDEVHRMGYDGDRNISMEMIGEVDEGQEVVSFQQSGGEALIPANKALFVSSRPARERLRWDLDAEQDDSVRTLLGWIDYMWQGLATLAIHKYLESKSRGALISNAAYRPARTPNEPAFDWITFEQARGTLDSKFQEGIATYDPSTQFIVYVFLLSPSENSLGIWRRKLPIPEELRDAYAQELSLVNAYVKKKQHVVAVDELPLNARTPKKAPGIRISTKPISSAPAGNQTFTSAGQATRTRTTSNPTPATKTGRSSSTLKKEHPEKKEEKKR